MSDRKAEIRRYLEATRADLLSSLQGLSPDDWDRPVVSGEGAWTIRQALAHVATAEPGQMATGERMLKGEARLGEGFSLDFWNQRQVEKRKGRSLDDLLNDLADSRKKLLAWIDGLSEADFEKSGQHGRGDVITVEQLCYRVGEHEACHAAEIRAALGK